MSKSVATIIFLILFGLPVLAQEEKVTKLPDYTKWQLSEWDFQRILYKGKKSYIVGASYQNGNDNRTVFVYFEPISEEQYQFLKSLDQFKLEKRVNSILSKTPLFIGYFKDGEDLGDIYFYEPSRKWFEIYRFWQSKFRFVEKVRDSEPERFIEERYKVKFED